MTVISEKQTGRRSIVVDLRRFLVGPSGGPSEALHAGSLTFDENDGPRIWISQRPSDFYHTGMLSPLETELDKEDDEQDDQGSSADTGAGESVMALANASQQSAVGMTLQVGLACEQIRFQATWGSYILAADEHASDPAESETSGAGPAGRARRVDLEWRRRQVEASEKVKLDSIPDGATIRVAEKEGVTLEMRRRVLRDRQFLTLSVVNRKPKAGPHVGEEDARIYQVRLDATDPAGQTPFVDSANTARRPDTDFWHQELLYRSVRQFAVGHGIAVSWPEEHGESVGQIYTEWVPEFEVQKASAVVAAFPEDIDLSQLSDASQKAETLALLRRLTNAYSRWIAEQQFRVPALVKDLQEPSASRLAEAATQNLASCAKQRDRIDAGLNLLDSDPIAFEAFTLANAAMEHSMLRARPGERARWFPFQIAFILAALPSLSDPCHVERDVFDLIWFPTGGGKTEAYLGLSAYTLFHRSLTSKSRAEATGTAIITRYTLRTLTIQQFERTVLAIMACELVRRRHARLSVYREFTVGLLVGSGATPKWLRKRGPADTQSAEALLGTWSEDSRGKLLPLKKCPWCGSPLDRASLSLGGTPDRLQTVCLSKACEFSTGLPIAVVDEHIWNDPPSFLVATIDKFAQLAWEPSFGRIFGVGTGGLPPNLIIQDELHLITDALGTVAGIYETVIDRLCERNGRGPKVVGATATIRRADEQIEKLFLRTTLQFPPSGLDHDDSFFYGQDTKVPGRLYVGVHAQGRSPKHTLPRLIAGILQSSDAITSDVVRDDYWTLVCYFNSLRELGGALVVAEDDARAYQAVLAKATNSQIRCASQMVEMTSHVPSYRIPEILDQLKQGVCSRSRDSEPIDILLATNMISVGVDVGRLGVMIIAGQPKTTAEYIQASSRVGRPAGAAGLVVIQYNWTRPRDRSHYERFTTYHGSFYRFVEATTVTPFSARARDRALRGAVVALARSLCAELAANRIADPVNLGNRLSAELRPVLDTFTKRVTKVDPREAPAMAKELKVIVGELSEFLTQNTHEPKFWTSWGVNHRIEPNARFVLTDDDERREGLWRAMLSLRDTDDPAPIALEE